MKRILNSLDELGVTVIGALIPAAPVIVWIAPGVGLYAAGHLERRRFAELLGVLIVLAQLANTVAAITGPHRLAHAGAAALCWAGPVLGNAIRNHLARKS
jgi:uncharacterized protein YqgC (DUF456 family)